MNKKEKALTRKHLIVFIIVIAVYIVAQIICRRVMGDEFKDYLFAWEWERTYDVFEPEQLELKLNQEGIVRMGPVTKEDGRIIYRLYPEHKGEVFMSVINKENGEEFILMKFRVSATGTITNYHNGNFTNYRAYHLNILLFCVVLAVLLWIAFVKTQKKLRYSYHSVFYSGLAIWMTLIAALQIKVWFENDVMMNVYSVFQSAPVIFMINTAIPLLGFCIALSVSNISLIRHEGFRTRNALGIILSVVMILGEIFYFVLEYLFSSGSVLQVRMYSAAINIYGSFYAFMECFLIGSIICGTLAAKLEPKYEMDYLIILGCMIKKDGTLYPLIRGRVDKAITFYKKQLEKTGKKAIFIPSGGKGSDEPISEAEAMKNYLLEQGIPESQIMMENQSKNTLQNMVFSKKIIEEHTPDAKVAFSTTNFHVLRSGIISRQNDFEPYGMGSKTKWYFWPNAYMREVVGMMVFKWKSMILILVPIVLFMIAIQFVS